MRNSPVHWHEGLFLRPHHFQAADRYWAERIQTSESWDHPYNYGLYSLELSREAVRYFVGQALPGDEFALATFASGHGDVHQSLEPLHIGDFVFGLRTPRTCSRRCCRCAIG